MCLTFILCMHEWAPVAHQVVVVVFEDAAEACNANATKIDDAGIAEKVYVGRCPATVVELPEVVAGLVVATNWDAMLSNWRAIGCSNTH